MACCKTLKSFCASEPFMFFYMMTAGMHLSIVPQLLLSKLCLTSFNTTFCTGEEENVIHQEAADWNMIMFLLVNGPSIITVILFGTTSDLFPKKYLLFIPPLVMGIQSIVYILSSYYMKLHVGFVVAGACLTCIYGDLQGAITLGYSYIADITDTSRYRTIRMAFVESSICIGQALGSYAGGSLLHKYGFVSVFVTSLAISFINICYVAIILPKNPSGMDENSDEDDDAPKLTCGLVVFRVLLRLKTVIKYFSCQKKGIILAALVAAVALVTSVLLGGENSIVVLFVKHTPLSLNAAQVGQFLLLLHSSRGIGMLTISIIGMTCCMPQDYILALIGTGALIITHVVIATAKNLKILFTVTPVSIFIPLALSSLRSAITKQVSATHHGTALAFASFISLIGVELMAAASNGLYKITESTHPGAAMLLLASVSGVAYIIIAILCIYTNCFDNERSRDGYVATDYEQILPNDIEERKTS